jgi:hypothetical protein
MKHFMNIDTTKTAVRRQRSLQSPFPMYEIHLRWMRDCRLFVCVIISGIALREDSTQACS